MVLDDRRASRPDRKLRRLAPNHLFVVIEHQLTASPVVFLFATAWVVGHLLGYLLLGIALIRAHAVPRWAAWPSRQAPCSWARSPTAPGWAPFRVAGYGLVLAGSIPAAVAILGWKARPPVTATDALDRAART